MTLIKYLASISSNLEEDDIRILKNNPIWPKKNSQPPSTIQYTPPPLINNVSPSLPITQHYSIVRHLPPPMPVIQRPIASMPIQRFSIGDLHVPSDLYRELGLPVIDWEGWWFNNTQEGNICLICCMLKFIIILISMIKNIH